MGRVTGPATMHGRSTSPFRFPPSPAHATKGQQARICFVLWNLVGGEVGREAAQSLAIKYADVAVHELDVLAHRGAGLEKDDQEKDDQHARLPGHRRHALAPGIARVAQRFLERLVGHLGGDNVRPARPHLGCSKAGGKRTSIYSTELIRLAKFGPGRR